jgi:hypothetical protein
MDEIKKASGRPKAVNLEKVGGGVSINAPK